MAMRFKIATTLARICCKFEIGLISTEADMNVARLSKNNHRFSPRWSSQE